MLSKSLSISLLLAVVSSVASTVLPSVSSNAPPSVSSTAVSSAFSDSATGANDTEVEGYVQIGLYPQYNSTSIGACYLLGHRNEATTWQNLSNRNATFYTDYFCRSGSLLATNLNSTAQPLSQEYISWQFL
ncbi:hypothetical protein [Parasitella parasitica]|uniref:Uncharacterized protein n=1 Tax=Parasitella parasitica TaxID=35722 RepID=A0A0B7N0E2_9FUNG|nr:hypothetical protein [Parasitella parasitica]